jgi:type IV pilus assembly protein PilE
MDIRNPGTWGGRGAVAGFTLIEMMVVVSIIAILAAIAIPQYGEHVRRSQIQEAQAGMLQIRTRLENYYQDNRSYAFAPGGAASGGFCFGNTNAVIGNDPNAAQVGTIAQQVSNRFFVFSCSTPDTPGPQTYTITARGSAGRVAGAGQQATFTVNEQNLRVTTHWGPVAPLATPCTRWLVSEPLGACP